MASLPCGFVDASARYTVRISRCAHLVVNIAWRHLSFLTARNSIARVQLHLSRRSASLIFDQLAKKSIPRAYGFRRLPRQQTQSPETPQLLPTSINQYFLYLLKILSDFLYYYYDTYTMPEAPRCPASASEEHIDARAKLFDVESLLAARSKRLLTSAALSRRRAS